MNFGEQFPSLKNSKRPDYTIDLFDREQIEKYCLDKQKVKELLNWIEETNIRISEEYVDDNWDEEFDKKKMELGL